MPTAALAHRLPALAVVADAQGGAVTRRQLADLGVSDEEVEGQVRACRWQLPVAGVPVLFTGPLPRRTLLWVAVLHGGDGAVLSHETAAEAYGLRPSPSAAIHVLAPHSRKIIPPPGVVIHRTRLPQPERAQLVNDYPPVTCVEDTVLDLVDQSRWPRQAVHWIMAACQAQLTTPSRILASMGMRRRIRHRQLVKEICAEVTEGADSPLELKYVRDVERRHGLPRSRRRKRERVNGGVVFRDVDYEEYATLVELDGRRGHEGEGNAFRDRRRDNASVLLGRTTLRFGWSDVASEPCQCAVQVTAVLKRNGWSGQPTRCSASCPLRVG